MHTSKVMKRAPTTISWVHSTSYDFRTKRPIKKRRRTPSYLARNAACLRASYKYVSIYGCVLYGTARDPADEPRKTMKTRPARSCVIAATPTTKSLHALGPLHTQSQHKPLPKKSGCCFITEIKKSTIDATKGLPVLFAVNCILVYPWRNLYQFGRHSTNVVWKTSPHEWNTLIHHELCVTH